MPTAGSYLTERMAANKVTAVHAEPVTLSLATAHSAPKRGGLFLDFAGRCPELVERLVFFGPIAWRARRNDPQRLPAWRLISLKDQWDRFVADVPPGEPPVLSKRHFDEWAEAYLDVDPEMTSSCVRSRVCSAPLRDSLRPVHVARIRYLRFRVLERFTKWLSQTLRRHARTCSGHPRLSCRKQDVDGRDEPGHDVEGWST